jgi:nucleotide-binding universal stress UspA family protein
MEKTKKILVPTDLSENSSAALRFAFSLGAGNRLEIMVLHVARGFASWPMPDELYFLSPQFLQWEADRAMVEASLDLSRFLEVQRDELPEISIVRRKVVLGPIAEKILDVACQESMDLIVMSPKPHGAFHRLLSRSITDRITREAPCPVLSVCPPQTQRPEPGAMIPLFGGIPQGSRA